MCELKKEGVSPSIRFKGFTDAWEQCKFEDLYKYASEGGTPDTNNLTYYINGKIPFVKIEDTDQKYIKETGSYINEKGVDNSSTWIIPSNSVIFTNGATVGNVAINIVPVTTKQGILGIIPNRLVSSEYLYYLLSSPKFQREVNCRIAIGTFATIILKNLNEIGVLITKNNKEQEKITTLLSDLDSLITLHQCKCDKLIASKKALLQKLFPQNIQATPEIRFKGFTDAWEQCKLGDLGTFKSNGVDKLSKPNEIPVNLLNYMDIYKRRELNNEMTSELMQVTAKSNQLIENNVLKGDVFFTPTSETADDIGHCLAINETLENTVYSYHLMRYRPYENSFYLKYPNYAFDTSAVKNQMSLMAQGVQRFVLSKSQFENIEISYTNLEEQKKIAEFLDNLDSLITLHQCKLEKLKGVKSSLLSKMFC